MELRKVSLSTFGGKADKNRADFSDGINFWGAETKSVKGNEGMYAHPVSWLAPAL